MIFYFLRGSLPWSGLEAKSQEPPFPGAFVEGFWRFGFPGAFVAFGGDLRVQPGSLESCAVHHLAWFKAHRVGV